MIPSTARLDKDLNITPCGCIESAFFGNLNVKYLFFFRYKKQVKHARLREQPRPALSYVSSGPRMVNAGSHTTLGPGTMVTLGPHEGPYEWGPDAALYHPNTISRP